MKLILDQHPFTCQIIRSSRRKTIRLRLLSPDRLEITAPAGCPELTLKAMIQNKQSWIIRQKTRLLALLANPVNAEVANGASILYLGRVLQLDILPAQSPQILLDGDRISLYVPQGSPRAASHLLHTWFIREARKLLSQKTGHWSARLGVQPQRICIRDQKTRWGSCSSKGTINYNWRILMAPPAVIDYLVIHECCHLHLPNHSRQYWTLVESLCPDFKFCRNWLKENGALLSRIL